MTIEPSSQEPPRNPYAVEEPPVVIHKQDYQDPFDNAWGGFLNALNEPAYGAQRVFDLFTLMAITLAFGLLFAALKGLGAPPVVFIIITSFVTFIAIGQMLFFGGESPRLASLVSGPISLTLIISAVQIWSQLGSIWAVLCCLPFGVPAGYLGGGLVAGVFLIADSLRSGFTRPAEDPTLNPWSEDTNEDEKTN